MDPEQLTKDMEDKRKKFPESGVQNLSKQHRVLTPITLVKIKNMNQLQLSSFQKSTEYGHGPPFEVRSSHLGSKID